MEYQKIQCPRRHSNTPHKGWIVTRNFGNGLREYRCAGCEKLFYCNVRKHRIYKWHPKYSSLKYMALVDKYNERAVSHLELLAGQNKCSGVARTDNPADADIFLVFGGDGTMLQAVHDYTRYGKPFLGLNFGKQGFFQNPPEQFSFDVLKDESYEIFSAPLLLAKMRTVDDDDILELALNDITIHEDVGQSAWLEVAVNGKTLVDNMVGDGLIISTPLGSTAYTITAGGAPVVPTLPVFELTPLAVELQNSMPVIIPSDSIVKIKVLQPEKREVRVSQGRVFRHRAIKEIEVKLAKEVAGIAFFKIPGMSWDNFFLQRWREKIYQS